MWSAIEILIIHLTGALRVLTSCEQTKFFLPPDQKVACRARRQQTSRDVAHVCFKSDRRSLCHTGGEFDSGGQLSDDVCVAH